MPLQHASWPVGDEQLSSATMCKLMQIKHTACITICGIFAFSSQSYSLKAVNTILSSVRMTVSQLLRSWNQLFLVWKPNIYRNFSHNKCGNGLWWFHVKINKYVWQKVSNRVTMWPTYNSKNGNLGNKNDCRCLNWCAFLVVNIY